jgi:hypothetical protein
MESKAKALEQGTQEEQEEATRLQGIAMKKRKQID